MRKNLGFTLIELMVVISIIGILSAIAVPNFFNWLSSSKLTGAAQDLISDMSLAKSYALKSNRSVKVIFTSTGYTVFDDKNADNVMDAGERIKEKKYPPGVSMSAVTFTGSKTEFFRTGAVSPAGSVTLTRGSGQKFKITVNIVGRIRTETL